MAYFGGNPVWTVKMSSDGGNSWRNIPAGWSTSYTIEDEFENLLKKECAETEKKLMNVAMKNLHPTKIIWNAPFTTVLWSDGTKTIVKATESEPFNQEVGFAMALLRKVYGGRSTYQKMLSEVGYREFTKEEKKAYRDAKKAKKAAEGK